MPSGHTDTATINERRKLTSGMVRLLRMLRNHERLPVHLTVAQKSRFRALRDRGMVTYAGGNTYVLTPLGLEAMERGA